MDYLLLMDGENIFGTFAFLVLFLNSFFLGTMLSNNSENFDLKNSNIPNLSFGKYYFESNKYGNTITLLSNIKPKNVEVFCLSKNKTYKIDVVFYQNIVGYKAEFKGDCDKIKIYSGKELVYYKDFSLE